MIEQALKKRSVTAICQSNHDFIRNYDHNYITKYLTKESIHHFPDLENLLELMYEKMPMNGKFLIISSADNCLFYPFFNKLKLYLQDQVSAFDELFHLIQQSKFHIDVKRYEYQTIIKKEKWLLMIQGRFISSISKFSDDEINEGIIELQQSLPEDILITLKYDFLTLTKSIECSA
jgi:hypothetical protein